MGTTRIDRCVSLIVVIFLFLGCSDPCEPRRDCLKKETRIVMVPMFIGKMVTMRPQPMPQCVQYGDPYIPMGCPAEKSDGNDED